VPFPGNVVVAVLVIGAVLLLIRILWAIPDWVRGVRRPEERKIRVVVPGAEA